MSGADEPETTEASLELRKILHQHGLRATPARMTVLQTLRSQPSPITHAALALLLQSYGFDKATVFRNLSDLVDVGLASRTELGDHVWRFEAIRHRHGRDTGHPHFVCNGCGSIHCLDELELTDNSLSRLERIGSVIEILIRGSCQACAPTERTAVRS